MRGIKGRGIIGGGIIVSDLQGVLLKGFEVGAFLSTVKRRWGFENAECRLRLEYLKAVLHRIEEAFDQILLGQGGGIAAVLFFSFPWASRRKRVLDCLLLRKSEFVVAKAVASVLA